MTQYPVLAVQIENTPSEKTTRLYPVKDIVWDKTQLLTAL